MFTDADSDMRGRLGTKGRIALGVQEGMASARNSGLESKTESPVRVQEKYGSLQSRSWDVLSSVRSGVQKPQDLGNYSSGIHNPTVEHPRGLVGESDEERTI